MSSLTNHVRAEEASAWDAYLGAARPDVGYKQSAWWADLLATRGWRSFEVVVREGEAIVGGARVLAESYAPGRCWYYVPDGPVLPAEPAAAARTFETTLALVDERRRSEPWIVSHLRLEPRWPAVPEYVRGFREARSWKEPRDTLCVDLSLSEAALLEQMKPKGRYNVRLAERKGVRVVEDRSDRGFADFVSLYKETFDRHGLRRHSTDYMAKLRDRAFPSDRGTLFFAEHEGRRLATALVLFHGDTATYKYGGSSAEHRNLMAPYLLHYEAMRRAKARGHRWYDFYGIAPKDDPDHRWADFSAFKHKFGGVERHFVPALERVYDDEAYRAWKSDQAD